MPILAGEMDDRYRQLQITVSYCFSVNTGRKASKSAPFRGQTPAVVPRSRGNSACKSEENYMLTGNAGENHMA